MADFFELLAARATGQESAIAPITRAHFADARGSAGFNEALVDAEAQPPQSSGPGRLSPALPVWPLGATAEPRDPGRTPQPAVDGPQLARQVVPESATEDLPAARTRAPFESPQRPADVTIRVVHEEEKRDGPGRSQQAARDPAPLDHPRTPAGVVFQPANARERDGQQTQPFASAQVAQPGQPAQPPQTPATTHAPAFSARPATEPQPAKAFSETHVAISIGQVEVRTANPRPVLPPPSPRPHRSQPRTSLDDYLGRGRKR